MNLLHVTAPFELALLGWLITVPAVLQAAWSVRRNFLSSSAAQHGWLAAIVAVALLWLLHVHSPVGMDFGLLGGALFTLVFGRARALLGLMAALLLHALLDGGPWLNLGISGLLLAVVPAWLASTLQRQIERHLPKNLFIFMIGNGLFVTLATTAGAAMLLLGVSVLDAPGEPRMLADHFAYALLLAWGEALLSGMLFSALVVFTPAAVLTYRQDLYLPPRRQLP